MSQPQVWAPGSIQFTFLADVFSEKYGVPKLPRANYPNFRKNHKPSTNRSYSGDVTRKHPSESLPAGQPRGERLRQRLAWEQGVYAIQIPKRDRARNRLSSGPDTIPILFSSPFLWIMLKPKTVERCWVQLRVLGALFYQYGV